MKTHELKILPMYFKAVALGDKKFEIRRNDRDFRQHDVLYLKEWNPETENYTGSMCTKYVRYIMYGGGFGLDKDYCIMSLE